MMFISKVLTWINCAIPKLDLAAQSDFPAHFQGLSGVVGSLPKFGADSTFPANH